jgi:hypothetical protein
MGHRDDLLVTRTLLFSSALRVTARVSVCRFGFVQVLIKNEITRIVNGLEE